MHRKNRRVTGNKVTFLFFLGRKKIFHLEERSLRDFCIKLTRQRIVNTGETNIYFENEINYIGVKDGIKESFVGGRHFSLIIHA